MAIAKFVCGVLLASSSTAWTQEMTHEMVNRAQNPADDAKQNSPKVPDVYAITGHFQRILVLRFKYDTDLLAGMEKIVKEQKIRNAVILSAAGSVRSYQIHQVSNRTFPSHDTFEKNPAAPADLVSMNGYIIQGRVHAHMTLATPDKAIGGHVEPGTNVFTFAILTLGVLNDDIDFSHLDDKTYR